MTFISLSIFALSIWDKLVSFNKKENRRIRIVLFDLIQSLFLVSYEEKLMFDSIWRIDNNLLLLIRSLIESTYCVFNKKSHTFIKLKLIFNNSIC